MNGRPMSWKHSGRCFVCGRSTKLTVHDSCGMKINNTKKEKTDNARKRYAAGHVPPFAYENRDTKT